ncbi:MRC1-like domain-containing protein [Hygrophoropsis aurantiaca]|uniref:MRC1-like domain-containing protein n=1 Tax=Hygrophoropsis aurantiaca TaxID=72124 RepID=A0ACB8AMZ4_9AGAM|nr:MRC1-like domain-containing protein [Hygrophoropsis aurantiaca]
MDAESSSSPVRPIKRATVTYGRRRHVEADECDSSMTLAGPSSPADILASPAIQSKDETKILLNASQESRSSAETCAEDGSDAGAEESVFQFDWKRKLQEMDEKFDENNESMQGIVSQMRVPPLAFQLESEVSAPFEGNENERADTMAHSPTTLGETTNSAGGSLTFPKSGHNLPLISTNEPSPESLAASRRRRISKTIDSDSEREGGSLSAESPVRNSVSISHLPSPSTPPTSEFEMPLEKTKADKGKGKASVRNVPPLRFDSETPMSDSIPKNHKGKRRENSSRPKIKAPTKKERRETALESTRILASRPVEIARTEGPTRTFMWLLERVKSDPKTIERRSSVPSSDPIQSFSSPQPGDSGSAAGSNPLSFGIASTLLAPPPRDLARNLSLTTSPLLQPPSVAARPLGEDSDDSEELGDISSIIRREEEKQKAEGAKNRLMEAKRLALQTQSRNTTWNNDSDDDLEIVHGDMHTVADNEAAQRKSDKLIGARPSKTISREQELSRLRASKSSGNNRSSHIPSSGLGEHLRESARSSFAAIPKSTKNTGVRTRNNLNKMLQNTIEAEKVKKIKEKEEEWVQRGGTLSKDETAEQKSLADRLGEYVENGLRNAVGAEDYEEHDSEWSDSDYEPAMRGSASPEPTDGDGDHVLEDIHSGAENDNQATDNDIDDEENLVPRHRISLGRAPRIIDSDDEDENDPQSHTRSRGRILVPDTSVMEIQELEHQVLQGNAESSLEEQTEDENDKENNTQLMFDRSDDKENKAVVRHSTSLPRPLLGDRPESLFGLEDGVRKSLSISSSFAETDDGMDLSLDDPRSPFKELLKEDDPFASPSASNSPFSARLLQATAPHPKSPVPAASTSRLSLDSPALLNSERINRLSSPQSTDLGAENDIRSKPLALQPSFLESLNDKRSPSLSFAPLNPVANGGFSQFFSDDNDENSAPPKIASRSNANELSLSLDVGLQPALEVSGTLRRKADGIFEKEQDYIIEAAAKKPTHKEVLYVNDHGFLTQTKPVESSPEVYRMTPSQAAKLHATQSLHDVGQSSGSRAPLRTLSFMATQESPEARPLRRLRRRSSSPSEARILNLNPPASPTIPKKKHVNALDVLMKPPAYSKADKARVEKSAFVAAEAEESDEEDRFGFGGKKDVDDEEEADDDDQDKVVEGLVDDTQMDEDTERPDLVQEKFREHEEEEDKKLEKLHQDAVEGKLRMKRRGRGIGFEDDSDDEDEDERNRRIRNRMYKKRKIAGDNLEALGQNEETRAFYEAYQHDLADDDNEFMHLQQEDTEMANEDQEDVEDDREAVSVSELRARLRQAAQNQESFQSLDPNDTTWVDRAEEENDGVRIKLLPLNQSKSVARQSSTGQPDLETERFRRTVESDQERTKLQSWAKSQGGHRNQGTGRSAVGAAVTGHARTKVKTGGGSLRSAQMSVVGSVSTASVDRGNTGKLVKGASMLASVSDRSSRFG